MDDLTEWTLDFIAKQKPLDPDFQRIIDERLWELLGDNELSRGNDG